MGLFVRLSLGPGYYSMRAQGPEGAHSLRAAGAGLNLALGGALGEDLALHGELDLHSTLDPRVGGGPAGERRQTGTSVSIAGVGAGIGGPFMPGNIYLGATLLLAQVRAVDRPSERLLGRTDLGLAGALALGKQWWLTPGWSLGGLARALVGRFEDRKRGGAGATWTALGLSLAACVTFD